VLFPGEEKNMQIIQNRRSFIAGAAQSRRDFLAGVTALAAVGVARIREAAAAEPPPETNTARFAAAPGICIAPQYCCMLAVNAEYAQKHPVATKRVVRAILKSADICAAEPERVARLLVDGGRTDQYDYALQSLRELPNTNWRDYDPEDTIRFFSLRLHEAGIVKANPNKIIASGTDWRYLDEIKRELKG
jgi:ABC-type nitrate/sulfonate/bicarbonate transport system substrate-binding protein